MNSDIFRQKQQPLNKIQLTATMKIKEAAQALWNLYDEHYAYEPRLTSVAKTALEQSVMFGIKAVTTVNAK